MVPEKLKSAGGGGGERPTTGTLWSLSGAMVPQDQVPEKLKRGGVSNDLHSLMPWYRKTMVPEKHEEQEGGGGNDPDFLVPWYHLDHHGA